MRLVENADTIFATYVTRDKQFVLTASATHLRIIPTLALDIKPSATSNVQRTISQGNVTFTGIVATIDSKFIVSSSNGMLFVWESFGLALIQSITAENDVCHKSGIEAMAITNNDKKIATGGYDGYLKLWECTRDGDKSPPRSLLWKQQFLTYLM